MESVKYFPAMDSITCGNGPVAGDTMMDIGFSNVNPVIHVPASPARSVEHGELVARLRQCPRTPTPCIRMDSVPRSARCSTSSTGEECAIADAMGIDSPKYDYEMFFSPQKYPDSGIHGSRRERKKTMWFSRWTNLATKETPVPTPSTTAASRRIFPSAARSTMTSARNSVYRPPIIDSMITLAGAMHEKSFFEDTRYDLDYPRNRPHEQRATPRLHAQR